MDVNSRAAALAIAVATPIARAWEDKRPAPDTRAVLVTAMADLKRHFGRIRSCDGRAR